MKRTSITEKALLVPGIELKAILENSYVLIALATWTFYERIGYGSWTDETTLGQFNLNLVDEYSFWGSKMLKQFDEEAPQNNRRDA